ncbi:HNH/endonuclease VII fold putative polymorphic toxin [Protofrankia coriariae]
MSDRNGHRVLGENGRPVMTREYTYVRPDGSKVIIQDHSAGHRFGEGGIGDRGPHFNVRPPENTRSGHVPGTDDHYPFVR